MMLNKRFVGLIGVAACAFLIGCNRGTSGNGSPSDQDDEKAHAPAAEPGHEHPAEGPHGGHLIELGPQQYHAELLHDEAAHTVTIHLLDASGKEAVSADEPHITLQLFKNGQYVDYTLKAAEGASEFTLVDEGLCDTLLHDQQVRGRLHVTIGGTQHTGIIEHQAHEHEGDEQAEHDDH
jgi:hypothetical protein